MKNNRSTSSSSSSNSTNKRTGLLCIEELEHVED
jgi:hypothetical protein